MALGTKVVIKKWNAPHLPSSRLSVLHLTRVLSCCTSSSETIIYIPPVDSLLHMWGLTARHCCLYICEYYIVLSCSSDAPSAKTLHRLQIFSVATIMRGLTTCHNLFCVCFVNRCFFFDLQAPVSWSTCCWGRWTRSSSASCVAVCSGAFPTSSHIKSTTAYHGCLNPTVSVPTQAVSLSKAGIKLPSAAWPRHTYFSVHTQASAQNHWLSQHLLRLLHILI